MQNEPINSQGINDSKDFAIWKIENFPFGPELIFFTTTHNCFLLKNCVLIKIVFFFNGYNFRTTLISHQYVKMTLFHSIPTQ